MEGNISVPYEMQHLYTNCYNLLNSNQCQGRQSNALCEYSAKFGKPVYKKKKKNLTSFIAYCKEQGNNLLFSLLVDLYEQCYN